MDKITDLLEQNLDRLGLTSSAFSELVVRLLDYGVISRNESQIEAALYDRYLQCMDIVEDYLAPMHLVLVHDSQFRFIRVFPPASVVPGVSDDDNSQDSPFQTGFRTKPSPNAIAVILILRVEYEKAVREGKVDDLGQVLLPLEELVITMKNLLKQSLPESQGERQAIFRQLRQLRLIKYSNETDLALENGLDSWLRIEPSITSFVSQAMLDQLYPTHLEPATTTTTTTTTV
ncbi:MAG: hypothetical protein ACJAQ6_000195 [Arenicella sp.]|jgi:hypothetical protein